MVLNWKRLLVGENKLSDSLGVYFSADTGTVCLRKILGSSPGLPMLILHQSCNHVALIET
jgi:hypothetical protein